MSAAKIVITVSGGNVNGFFSNDPSIEVYLVDYDNLANDLNQDCDVPLSPRPLQIFRSVIESENKTHRCLAKLAEKIGG